MPFVVLACKPSERDAAREPGQAGASAIELPRRALRLGIFSKFEPTGLAFKGSGAIFFQGLEAPVNDRLEFVATGDRVAFARNGRRVLADHILIQSHEPFELSILSAREVGTAAGRRYTGDLELRASAGLLLVTLSLPVEAYVRAVARAETGDTPELSVSARAELLRAMEIAVRSYSFAYPDRHPDEDFEFCDLTHCMYFAGNEKEIAVTNSHAVLVDRHGDFARAYFSSTCGGRLVTPGVLWPAEREDRGLYRVGPDRREGDAVDLCAASPHFRWTSTISREQLLAVLGPRARGLFSGGTAPRIRTRLREGRVAALLIEAGGSAEFSVSAADFLSAAGRGLGWNTIKSNAFEIEEQGAAYRFTGRGLGHGVGLCQWGARHQARQGAPAEAILHFYFPGARIVAGRYD